MASNEDIESLETWERKYNPLIDHIRILENDQMEMLNSAHQSFYKNSFIENYFIGKGSYGHVFHVKSTHDDEYYAVKKVWIKNERLFIEHDKREIKLWSKLKNEFLVEYKTSWIEMGEWKEKDANDFWQIKHSQKILYIQMELCRANLRELINSINSEFDQSFERGVTQIGAYLGTQIFSEILEGFYYLHSQDPPIMHRDISLANILVTDSNSGNFIKLSDFGLAKYDVLLTADDNDEKDAENFDVNKFHSQNTGKFKYMAPEVTTGHYDIAADLNSLGIVLSELMCVELENIESFSDDNNYYFFDRKEQINIIKNLTHEWASMRPSCKMLLESKDQWCIPFEDIKTTVSLCDVFYKYFDIHFNKSSECNEFLKVIVSKMIVKKCQNEILKQKKNECFDKIKNIQFRVLLINTNVNENLSNEIFKNILHSFNICINELEMCEFLENTLYHQTKSNWQCFVTVGNEQDYSRNCINWFDLPIYIVYFCNEFREAILGVMLVNTSSFDRTKVKGFKVVKSNKILDEKKLTEIKSIAESCFKDNQSIEEIQKNFSVKFREIQCEYECYCYMSVDELLLVYTFLDPKHFLAFRYDSYCVIISSSQLEASTPFFLEFEERLMKKLNSSEAAIINSAFKPQLVACSLLIKLTCFNNEHKLFRICDHVQCLNKNYKCIKILGFEAQIQLKQEKENEQQIAVNEIQTITKINKNENKEQTFHESLKLLLNNKPDNSSIKKIIEWLKELKNLVNSAIYFNNIGSKQKEISDLKILQILEDYYKKQNAEIEVLIIQILSYDFLLKIKQDHKFHTFGFTEPVSLIIKQLLSKNDNNCIHSLKLVFYMILNCPECKYKLIKENLLAYLLTLLKPFKSLSLIKLSMRVMSILVTPGFEFDFEKLNSMLEILSVLIEHFDKEIILNVICILRNLMSIEDNYRVQIAKSPIMEKLINLLLFSNFKVQDETCILLAHILIECNNFSVFHLIHFSTKLLDKLYEILDSDAYIYRYCVILVLKKSFLDNESHVQVLIDSKLSLKLIESLQNDYHRLQRHTFTVILKLLTASTYKQKLIIFYSCDFFEVWRNLIKKFLPFYENSTSDTRKAFENEYYTCIDILNIFLKMIECFEHETLQIILKNINSSTFREIIYILKYITTLSRSILRERAKKCLMIIVNNS